MTINGIVIDPSKLLSKQEILDHLLENGATDSELTHILVRHEVEFGNTLMWRYPISDGVHAGAAIIAVREGFLSLPYDGYDKVDYELYELESASLFDENALQVFLDDWKSFSDDLTGALGDMLSVIRNKIEYLRRNKI